MQKIILYFRTHKNAAIGTAAGLVIVIIGVIGFFVFRSGAETNTNAVVNTAKTTKETKVARRLDGVSVDAAVANAQPIAIMVENLTDARPQSGLETARVVYEALAEGGITRFVALFDNTTKIDQIGPVRSARPYFLDIASEYRAVYGHVGGSPQAIAEINNKTHDITDLNQFYKSQYYWRSKDRAAPHNVYTSTDLLTFALRDMDMQDATGDFAPWTFAKQEAKAADRGTDAQEIVINYSTFSYKTRYVYDRASNTYKRFHSDVPHTVSSGTQIAPKNVVVQYAKTSVIDEGRLAMDLDEGGRAIVFTNGNVTEGTWVKGSGRTLFLDASGDDVKLTPGQTWVEVVPTDREVQYPQATTTEGGV